MKLNLTHSSLCGVFACLLALPACRTHVPVESAAALPAPVLDFDRLRLGSKGADSVFEAVGGRPWRMFSVQALAGTTPVQLPYSTPGSGRATNPFLDDDVGLATAQASESEVEAPEREPISLRVFEYEGSDVYQPYYVVLLDDRVAYWIGPVPESERSVESVTRKYGKPRVETSSAVYTHVERRTEIHAYQEHGIAFLRRPNADTFSAKVVGFKSIP